MSVRFDLGALTEPLQPIVDEPASELAAQQPASDPAAQQSASELAAQQSASKPAAQQSASEPAAQQSASEPAAQEPASKPAAPGPQSLLDHLFSDSGPLKYALDLLSSTSKPPSVVAQQQSVSEPAAPSSQSLLDHLFSDSGPLQSALDLLSSTSKPPPVVSATRERVEQHVDEFLDHLSTGIEVLTERCNSDGIGAIVPSSVRPLFFLLEELFDQLGPLAIRRTAVRRYVTAAKKLSALFSVPVEKMKDGTKRHAEKNDSVVITLPTSGTKRLRVTISEGSNEFDFEWHK
jgi:hypothetical protein